MTMARGVCTWRAKKGRAIGCGFLVGFRGALPARRLARWWSVLSGCCRAPTQHAAGAARGRVAARLRVAPGASTCWLGGAPRDGPRPSSSSVPTHLVTVQS